MPTYKFNEGLKKMFDRTSYRLYLVFWSRLIEINFWAKTQQLGFIKINYPRDWDTSETPETSLLKLSMRRIQLCWDPSSIIIIWKVILQKHPKNKNEAWVPRTIGCGKLIFSVSVSDGQSSCSPLKIPGVGPPMDWVGRYWLPLGSLVPASQTFMWYWV